MIINTVRNTLVILILLFISCIEPFFTNKNILEEVLVVEGMITNDAGPYKIYLSKTISPSNPKENPVIDATVKIFNDIGFEETLMQTEPGVFITDTFGIRGTIGRKYKIVIETFAGKKYESEYSELKEPVPIDELFCVYELKHDFVLNIDTKGYRLYAEFQPYIDKNTYLMWRSEETYEYESPFLIDYVWVGYLKPFEKPDTFETCWTTAKIREINTLINDPQVNQQSITVKLNHTDLNKFAIKYSLLLKQLSVDEETNKYWKAVNDLNESQNSFYNHQPYQIKGNIHNVSDPDEIVLGYFFAAGITKKRIFHYHPGLARTIECTPDPRAIPFLPYWPESMWPIYIVDVNHSGALAIGDEHCFDCRLKGGTIKKPDFWK